MQNTPLIKLVESQLNINNNPTEWSTLNSRDRGISCPSLSLYDITHKDVSDVSNHSFCTWNSDLECSTLLDINNNPPPPFPSSLTAHIKRSHPDSKLDHSASFNDDISVWIFKYGTRLRVPYNSPGQRWEHNSQGFAEHAATTQLRSDTTRETAREESIMGTPMPLRRRTTGGFDCAGSLRH